MVVVTTVLGGVCVVNSARTTAAMTITTTTEAMTALLIPVRLLLSFLLSDSLLQLITALLAVKRYIKVIYVEL